LYGLDSNRVAGGWETVGLLRLAAIDSQMEDVDRWA